MTEREQALIRRALSVLLLLAVAVATAAAWASVHPLAGAAVLLASTGALWTVHTRREHEARLKRETVEAQARARQVSVEGFSTARPVTPPAPFGGAS